MEPSTRIELVTFPLPRECSAAELRGLRRRFYGGECRIRTCEGFADGFTVRSHWPLGQLPRFGERVLYRMAKNSEDQPCSTGDAPISSVVQLTQ